MKPNLTNGRRVFVIIPADEDSSRMDSEVNRMFTRIYRKSIVEKTLQAFDKFADTLLDSNIYMKAVVVTHKSSIYPIKKIVRDGRYTYVNEVIQCGTSRTESVYIGIQALQHMPIPPTPDDIIFVHDADRCMVDQATLENCLMGIMNNPVCAAAVPGRSSEDKNSPLMDIQTPQVFRYSKLVNSYINAVDEDIEAADDLSLAEAMGYKITMVQGSETNIKISEPGDIPHPATLKLNVV